MEDIVDALELPDLKRGERVEVQEHEEGRMVSELLSSQELNGALGPAAAAEEKAVYNQGGHQHTGVHEQEGEGIVPGKRDILNAVRYSMLLWGLGSGLCEQETE
jgi:hypothetical protein